MTLLDRIARRGPFAAVALMLLALAGSAFAQEPESIRLTAKPSVVVADGSTASTITAEVRDRSGRLVGDEETVHFSTTLGTIEAAAKIQGGQASVTLTSPTVPGTATVTASAGHATAQVQVTFATQVIGEEEGVKALVIRADYLLYNDYEQTVDALGDVEIRIGGLRVKADRAQVDTMRNSIVAQGQPGASNLTITRGDTTLAVDRLQYKWDAQMGFASGLSDPMRGLYTIHGGTLTTTHMTGTIAQDAFLLRELVPSPLSIKASRIVYLPGQELQFTGAQILLNGKRRFGLPLHVMPVGPSRVGQPQYVGIGSRGPLLDLPYYVAAGTKGTSQLRLKYNAPEGLYGATIPGWALDLIGKYSLSQKTEGTVELTRLTSPDWGLTLNHNQSLGRATRAYLNLDTRSGYGFNTRYSLGHVSLSHQGKGYTMSLNGAASHINHTNANAALSLQSGARPLPGGFSWNTGVQIGRRWVAVSRTVDEETTVIRDTSTTQGINMRLNAPSRTVAGVRLSASLGPGLTYTDGRPRRSLLGTVGASRPFGKRGNLNVTYNYNDFGLSSSDTSRYVGMDKQTVTASLTYGVYPRWSLSAFATMGLEHDSQNMRMSANYRFSDQWNLSVNGGYFRQVLSVRDLTDPNLIRSDSFGATNVEVRLTRVLGERALALVYESYRNRIYLDYMPGAVW